MEKKELKDSGKPKWLNTSKNNTDKTKFTFKEWATQKDVRLYIARGAAIKAKLSLTDTPVDEKTFNEAVRAYTSQAVR